MSVVAALRLPKGKARFLHDMLERSLNVEMRPSARNRDKKIN